MPNGGLELISPSDADAQLAREASRVLTSDPTVGQSLRLQISAIGGAVVSWDLPQAATGPLVALLEAIGAGKAVAVGTTGPEISMPQATALLHVSPPYLVNLIANGTLPARMVNDEWRLQMKHVLARRRDTRRSRRAALDELSECDQELGLR